MKITKRMLSVFVALIMMLSIAVVAVPVSAASASLSIGEVECTANGNVVVPISVENNPGVWGINLQIEYDEALTYSSFVKVNSNIGNCMATTANNVLTILLEASSEEKDITDDGVLANITFSTTAWAEGKVFDVKFTNVDRRSVTDATGKDLLANKDPQGNPLEPIALKDGAVKCVAAQQVPTEPSTQPTQPSVKPEEPTQPSVKPEEPTQPSVKPEEPTQPTACVHATTVTVGAKKATYFAAGYSGDVKCANCGAILSFGKTLAKLKLAKPKFSVKAGKKSFKVTYNKVTGATGFEVRYRIKGKWTVKSYPAKKKVTKTIKKLKKGKYSVQVRAYVQSGKTKAYSAWAKTIKTQVK